MPYNKLALLLAATLATATTTSAQDAIFDPAQLPSTMGKVAQYTLTPRGGIDGLILEDGTEVQVSPRVSSELAFAVRPGDAVTVHGLKAHAIPMIQAMSVTNDATHVTIVTQRMRGSRSEDDTIEDQGRIKAQLHDSDGDVDGVLLEDGTTVDLPDPEAVRLRAQLAIGQTVYVRGQGTANVLGRNIAAQFVGADKQMASLVQGASEDDDHGRGGRGHGGPGRGGPEHGGPGRGDPGDR